MQDASGQRFGRLIVIAIASRGKHHMWECLCDCGQTTVKGADNVKSGRTKSCGCWHDEGAKNRARHGMARKNRRASEHLIWSLMLDRCSNARTPSYKNYGGRGISVCSRWHESFEAFLADMGNRPSPAHSIDRMDRNGNYCPENCRWATRKEQNRNKRNNHFIEHEGRTLCLAEWAQETGINSGTINQRIKLGWSTSSALTKPVKQVRT